MKIKIEAGLLILFGSLLWSLTMVKSGIVYDYGMGFWGPNGHDGIWHVSLAEGLATGSGEIPIFAGEQVQNYHVGFDLFLAIIHKLTFIPIINLYFQILPPIFALLIGYFSYKFIFEWSGSSIKAWWSTFFVYSGGSWGWLISFLKDGNFGGESMFWAQQSISTLINPPFAMSLVFIFVALYLLVLDFHSKSNKHLFLVSLLFGVLIQIKVYAGLLALTGLFIAGFWRLLQRRKIDLIKVFLGAFLVSLFIFSPSSDGVRSVIEFRPFWFLETMMEFPDRLKWSRYAQAMTNYKLAGDWLKAVLAYFVAFLIFWFGNLGSRIIKEPQVFKLIKNYRKLDSLQVFLLSVIATGIVVPLFFVQSGTAWNTIQFMYYSLMFSSLLAGIAVGEYLDDISNQRYKIILATFVILITLPTTFSTLFYHYLPSRPPAKISLAEIEALEFLGKQPEGIVLTQSFDGKKAQEAIANPPRPLYAYESTAYVSALTGKKVFLEDQVNLEIIGYDWRDRRNKIEDYFSNPNKEFIHGNSIDYIYLVKELGILNTDLNKIFENEEIIIYSL